MTWARFSNSVISALSAVSRSNNGDSIGIDSHSRSCTISLDAGNRKQGRCSSAFNDRRGLCVHSWLNVFLRFAKFYSEIERLLINLEFLCVPTASPPAKIKLIDVVLAHITVVEKDANDFDLEGTKKRLKHLGHHMILNRDRINAGTDNKLADQIKVLREAFIDDLKERVIFVPHPMTKVGYFNQPDLFGAEVYYAFESAREDIENAGNCYATDNDTACVFHLMRVAERGMRVLAKHLKVDKKLKFPLEYADWGTVISSMSARLEGLRKMRRGPKKDAELRFYSGAINQCEFLNNFWRVEVSHARKQYNSLEALNSLNHVKEFMQLLAKRLKENRK